MLKRKTPNRQGVSKRSVQPIENDEDPETGLSDDDDLVCSTIKLPTFIENMINTTQA